MAHSRVALTAMIMNILTGLPNEVGSILHKWSMDKSISTLKEEPVYVAHSKR